MQNKDNDEIIDIKKIEAIEENEAIEEAETIEETEVEEETEDADIEVEQINDMSAEGFKLEAESTSTGTGKIITYTVVMFAVFLTMFLLLYLNFSKKEIEEDNVQTVSESSIDEPEMETVEAVKRKATNVIDESLLDIVDINAEKYTYDMMVDDIDKLCNAYSDIIFAEIIGQSIHNKNIYVVTLGNKDADNHIFVQASIHGREYMNSQLVMKMLEYYAEFCDVGKIGKKTYRELFDNTCIHVIPMTNPDGVTISQFGVEALGDAELEKLAYEAYLLDKDNMSFFEGDAGFSLWVDNYQNPGFKRGKNDREITFEEYQEMWKANGRGVDLNNNFDADWENITLKEYPCYGSFKGTEPVSEPESKAISEYALKYDFDCYLSYHSRGELIYYDCQGNDKEFSEIEEAFANEVASVIGYNTERTIGAFNVNLGGFGDWIQLGLKKRSVTIESGKMACPLPISEFRPMWLRHRLLWGKLASLEGQH